MICKRCHSSVDEQLNYCPVCGEKLRLHPENEKTAPPAHRSRLWMYLLILFAIGATGYGFLNVEKSYENLSVVAQNQLTAIHNNRQGEAYYEYTSNDFQQSTSFENFKKFINENTFLTKYKSVQFDTIDVTGNNAVLKGNIIDENDAVIPIKYVLVEEDSDWKVLNIELGEKLAPPTAEEENSLELIIKKQLKAFQDKDLQKAYDETSNDFKKATPFDKFKEFIDHYTALSNNNNVLFKNTVLNSADRATITVQLSTKEGEVPAEYTLVKEDGQWKIWNIRLLILPLNENAKVKDDPALLLPPIQGQLKALQSKDIEKAYQMTSEGFRAATPLKEFKQFIEQYPALTEKNSEVKEHIFYKGAGKVHAIVHQNNKTYHIDYTLSKENGKWQIWGMQISDTAPLAVAAPVAVTDFDASSILDPVKEQLEEIKKGDIKKAYETYTSPDFKKFTSQEQFSVFLKNYAIFSNNASATFADPTFENNMAIIVASFTATNGEANQVEYNLNKENDAWKIVAIRVFSSTAPGTDESTPPAS